MNYVKRILAAIMVCWTATALAQTGQSGGPASGSDQQVQAADLVGKRGQQKVDLFTGSFGYSIPIACAPARNNSEPSLGLSYSSSEQNGWCGMGWNLEIGSIERFTRDGFPIAYATGSTPAPLAAYDDTKGFMLNLFGKGYKLFSVATNTPVVEYRAEVDTDFLRCFLNTANNNWTVYDKGGNAWYFGESSASREANPKTGWGGYSGTFRWALDQIVTATGDWTTIAYTTYTSSYTHLAERTIYPTQITYNGHTNVNGFSANATGSNTITFQTGIRTSDWGFSFRSGFRTDQTRLLTNIVCAVGSQNIWNYQLHYGISPATDRSMLTNVVLYGYNGSTATPFITNSFAYQANPNAVSFGPAIAWTNLDILTPDTNVLVSYEPYVTEVNYDNSGFGYTVADLIDMDGDGLPDRVCYNDAPHPNQYRFQKNLGMQAGGNGKFGAPFAFGPSSTATNSSTPTTASSSNPVPDGDSNGEWAAMNTPYGRIRDINGDGLPDRVMDYWQGKSSAISGTLPYVPYTNYEVQLNTGQGFTGATYWPVSSGPVSSSSQNAALFYCVESGGAYVGFFDINGDGRPDRLMTEYTNVAMTNLLVQYNTGTNFSQPELFGPYHSQNWNGASGQSLPYTWAGIASADSQMIDLNGDGLPDHVMYPATSSGGTVTHPASYYAVEYNDGYSFESTNTSGSVGGASDQWNVPVLATNHITYNGVDYYEDSLSSLPFGGLFDVNGDGLPDRVVFNLASWGSTSPEWFVFLNNGHGFATTPITVTGINSQGQTLNTSSPWWGVEGAGADGNLATLIDINGDGLLDRVMTVSSGANTVSTVSNYFLVQLNQGPYPDLLTNINNGIGGVISVTYNPSTAYDNRVDPTNPNSVSHMPFVRYVVATVAESDGVNPLQTTTYGYGGGYYDGVRREFHGFAVVTNTDPTLRYTVTYFHTGGGRNYAALGEYQDTNSTTGLGNFPKAGMAYRVETYGNDGALYHVQVNEVNQISLGNARYFPYITNSFDCDYPGNGTAYVTAEQFAYDAVGNVTNKTEYGQVSGFNPASVGTFSFTDMVTSDTRQELTSFAALTGNGYIVDRPATNLLADVNGSTVRQTVYTYNPNSGTVAAKLTRIAPGSFATNGYGYNSYGLVSVTTNAEGVVSSVVYDATYNTYPATATVGPFTTTTSYDPRSGALAVSTDPAGLTVSNSFDSFLRPMETDQFPIGSGTSIWMKRYDYPAVLQAITSGNAVNYADEVQNDGVGGFTNRTYIDGFGRPIQSCTEGENGNYRVISTAYDGRGNAFLTTWPIFGSIAFTKPASGLSATLTGYDPAGRVATNGPVSVTFNGSSGAFTSATTLAGDSGSPLGVKTWSYVNGSNPWWIIYTDEDGQVRRYGLDAFGRTNQILEVDGTSTYTNTLKYDLADNLTNLVNANSENIFWAYNGADEVVAMADPYLGVWTYARDLAGRLRLQTDARGDVVSNSYVNPTTGQQDALGRLQVQTVYGSNYTSHALFPAFTNIYLYDTSTDANYVVYKGLLAEVIDSQGWEKTSYDTRARAIKTSRYLAVNGSTNTSGFTFDDGDNVTSTAYPHAGPTITNVYFHGGSVSQVSRLGGSSFYTIGASGYDEFKHATNFVYGNGVTTTRSYYGQSKRLNTITAGSLFTRTYQYTKGDDITSLIGTGLGSGVTIAYNNLHRIKTYTGLTGSYAYDPTGNLTNNIEGGGSTYTFAHPRVQAVRTAFGYTNLYDLCGNMIVRHGGTTNAQGLVYDAENRLTAIAQAGVMSDEFGYAFDGDRLWKRLNQNPTNIQMWIGNIYEQKDGKTLFHVFANGGQVCTFEASSPLNGGPNSSAVGYYYHEDSLTSSSALSSGTSTATNVEVNVWYPFGRVQTASPQASFQVSRRFTGQVFDAESGLYYYNARYYDPELGRFIQPDDVISDFGNPQSYNRYSYVLNDPLRYTDPTGHQDDENNYTGASGRALLQEEDSDAIRVVQSGRQLAGGEAALAKVIISVTPAGTAMSAGEAYTGKDAYSNGQLTTRQRVTSGVFAALPGVVKASGKVLKAGEELTQAGVATEKEIAPSVGKALGILDRYPQIVDARTGRNIPFPSGVGKIIPASQRVSWGATERAKYITEWYERGYATPTGGWKNYDIHHILPREYGGGNGFWNLVPVERGTHQDLFNSFWQSFSGQ